MARARLSADANFGERLASFRHAAGLSQVQLGKLCEISQRMIAYYETRGALPPGC